MAQGGGHEHGREEVVRQAELGIDCGEKVLVSIMIGREHYVGMLGREGLGGLQWAGTREA